MLEDCYSSFGEEIARAIDRRAQEVLTPLCWVDKDTVRVGMYIQSREGEAIDSFLSRADALEREVYRQLGEMCPIDFVAERVYRDISKERFGDPLNRMSRSLAIGIFADVPSVVLKIKAGGFGCPI